LKKKNGGFDCFIIKTADKLTIFLFGLIAIAKATVFVDIDTPLRNIFFIANYLQVSYLPF